MNKSFFIIFIPAVFVAAMYISLGIYPPARVYIGIGIFALALGIYRVRAMKLKRGITNSPAAPSDAAPTQASTQH